MKIDDLDRGILRALQENARVSLTAIAKRVHAAPATVHERLAKLRRRGVVQGYAVRVDAALLGYSVTALIHLTIELANDLERTLADLRDIPEVEEVHVVTGEYDLVVKVRARDTAHLQSLLVNRVHRVTGFKRSATEICLTTPLERIGPAL
jgi:Lrp/AsnC family transcriptional regulator for asnA, asnC and gidA